jgi:hypothetical protein
MLVVMLGIFSAGATFLASGRELNAPKKCVVHVGLTAITIALLWV